VLKNIAGDLHAPTLGSLLPQIVLDAADSTTGETFERRYALIALLQRYAKAGFVDEAWELARQAPPKDRYLLIAVVAPHVAEPARSRGLEEAIRELQVIADFPWWRPDALKEIVAELSESSLRACESELVVHPINTEVIVETIKRYASLGLVADAIRVAKHTRSSGDIWTFVAPHLDADGVGDAYGMSEHFWPYARQAERALAARRVELGAIDQALERVEAQSDPEIKFASIAGMASRAQVDLLERLSEMVLSKSLLSAQVEPLPEADEAVAAIAGRYGALGHYDRALDVLGLVSHIYSTAIAEALEGMAAGLEGQALERAVAISLSLESTNWPEGESRALAAVLPRLARHGVDEARRAVSVAAAVGVSRSRRAAFASLMPVLNALSPPDLHSLWVDATHLIATRTRQHVFDDLTPLMPLVGRLGGAPALDGASAAVAQIVQRWP